MVFGIKSVAGLRIMGCISIEEVFKVVADYKAVLKNGSMTQDEEMEETIETSLSTEEELLVKKPEDKIINKKKRAHQDDKAGKENSGYNNVIEKANNYGYTVMEDLHV